MSVENPNPNFSIYVEDIRSKIPRLELTTIGKFVADLRHTGKPYAREDCDLIIQRELEMLTGRKTSRDYSFDQIWGTVAHALACGYRACGFIRASLYLSSRYGYLPKDEALGSFIDIVRSAYVRDFVDESGGGGIEEGLQKFHDLTNL